MSGRPIWIPASGRGSNWRGTRRCGDPAEGASAVWEDVIWTQAETAGGKEVEGVENTWKGKNEMDCLWGMGEEEERERSRKTCRYRV